MIFTRLLLCLAFDSLTSMLSFGLLLLRGLNQPQIFYNHTLTVRGVK